MHDHPFKKMPAPEENDLSTASEVAEKKTDQLSLPADAEFSRKERAPVNQRVVMAPSQKNQNKVVGL